MSFSTVRFATRTAKNKREKNEDDGAGIVVYPKSVEIVPLLKRKTKTYNSKPILAAGAIVADGLGGGPDGDKASKMAVDCFFEIADLFDWQKGFIPSFLSRVYRRAKWEMQLTGTEGATTFAAAMIDKDKNIYVGYSGDSRIYLVRKNTVYLLTRDHNKKTERINKGLENPQKFDEQDNNIDSLLTNCLAADMNSGLDFKIFELPNERVQKNDTLVLLTDGASVYFHGKREGQRLRYKLRDIVKQQDLEGAAEQIIQTAKKYQDDNATTILMRIE